MHDAALKSAPIRRFLSSATARLALSYLVIIMIMSVGFSVIFYQTSSRELGRQFPQGAQFEGRGFFRENIPRPIVEELFAERIAEGRQALLERILLVNIVALLAGGVLSYYLARRTLHPIERNMEAQTQFVSDASHELRTPLTALLTTNEVALRRKKISEQEARDILRQNIDEVNKLQTLTDSLLRLAVDTHNQTPLRATSLREVTAQAITAVAPAAEAKQIVIDDSTPTIDVLAHVQNLIQIVGILLDNAIKYSEPGATIYVDGHVRGKYGYLTVRDKGQGIPASDLPRIFDRFYRADQSRNKQRVDGYGIGLSLAKKLIEQQGGEVTVTSTYGHGSTFTIRLLTT